MKIISKNQFSGKTYFYAIASSCPPGFSGEDCAQQIDDCQGDPCQNGGQCQDLVEGYRLDIGQNLDLRTL